MRTKTLNALMTISCLLVMPARAQVNYAVSGTTAYVTNSPNASGDIVIASTYNGYPVTAIAGYAFSGCSSLTSVTIPDGVTDIGWWAFQYDMSLMSVTIPNSVTNIGGWAFFSNGNLTSVTLGNSVASIGDYAFDYCFGLTNITVDPANPSLSSLDGVLFDKAQATLITFPGGRGGSYVIPSSVTYIGDYAFRDCTSLTSLTIPEGVIGMGFQVCYYCTNLTNVTIGNTLTNIGGTAFLDCHTLASLTIPDSVTDIGQGAFGNCYSLTRATIGDSVTTIGDWAFSYCTSLTNLTFLGNAPSLNGEFVYDGPGATVYYYYGTTGWGPIYAAFLPTVMLGAPAPQISTATVGVKPGGFGFTLTGVTNQTVVVEASSNLANWQPLWTNTLSGASTDFVDPQWSGYPRRFYRASTP